MPSGTSTPAFTELEVRSHLARFGYRGEEVFKDCATLSGGEMARLRFAELALERPNLMFLDEPTNHLDIFMRETLTDALSAYTGTLLLVTHDRYLMQTLGCPILYLEDGKATFYQNFQKLHDRDTSKQPEPAKQEDKPQKAGYGKEQRRRRAEVRTRLKALETEIEELAPILLSWKTRSTTRRFCATTCFCGISAMNWMIPASTSRNCMTSGKSWQRNRTAWMQKVIPEKRVERCIWHTGPEALFAADPAAKNEKH